MAGWRKDAREFEQWSGTLAVTKSRPSSPSKTGACWPSARTSGIGCKHAFAERQQQRTKGGEAAEELRKKLRTSPNAAA